MARPRSVGYRGILFPLAPPQLLRRQLRTVQQRLELGPHDAGANAPVERALREAAVGAGDHVLAPDHLGQPNDAFGQTTASSLPLTARYRCVIGTPSTATSRRRGGGRRHSERQHREVQADFGTRFPPAAMFFAGTTVEDDAEDGRPDDG